MWKFKTERFAVKWWIEDDPYVDTTFDETGETAEKLASGEWQAFQSTIAVSLDGEEIGVDYLGGSIYADPSEFRDHIGSRGAWGSYFTDMVRSAIDEARQHVRDRPPLPYIRDNAN
jgi:hypothetical protein